MTDYEQEKIRHLLVIKDLDGQRTVPLEVATYSLGRDPQSSIVLHSKAVSRHHAMLLRVTVSGTHQHSFRIIDGNYNGKRSTNGIYVNGHQTFSHDLHHGDFIEFGDQAEANYYAISNLTDQEFAEICDADNPIKFLNGSQGTYSTIVADSVGSSDNSEAALARLASFPELIPNPIIELDLSGQITYLNPSAFGKFPDLQELQAYHPLLRGLKELVQSQAQSVSIRSVQLYTGEVYEQFIHYMAESDLIRVFLTDITERKRAEEELHKRDRLLQAVAAASSCLLTEMNHNTAIKQALTTLGEAAEVDRVVIYENHAHPITGAVAMSLRFVWVREAVVDFLPPLLVENQSYSVSGVKRWHDLLHQGKTIKGTWQDLPISEQALLNRDRIQSILMVPIWLGKQCWGHLNFHDCCGERHWSPQEESILATMAASLSGVLQRQQTEEMMRHQALHDLVTELPNRVFFHEHLSLVLQEAKHHGDLVAVLFVDLDRFKAINDTLGHTVGDKLLKEVAQRLKDSLGSKHFVARWGGDEFTIVLSQLSQLSHITHEASRLLSALQPAFHLGGQELYISASIGIAIYDDDSVDAESLVKNADTALYKAKAQGRHNYQLYDASMNTKSPELLAIEKGLRNALENELFELAYQPQVDLKTKQIIALEALLRWHDPTLGSVSPGTFIPIAEETGLIIPMGEWVLRQACTQNKSWQKMGLPHLTISVNLSPKQFRQPRLVEAIAQVLADTQLEARYLELEITESTAIEDIKFTQKIMQDLSSLGIRLSIDDFGTGHSSLSRLQLLPLHTLKVDKSFIKDISRNSKTGHIVSAIVSLGKSLDLNVVAEGVEDEEQLQFLRANQCDAAQGFLFCHPLPAEKMTLVLRRQKHKMQSMGVRS